MTPTNTNYKYKYNDADDDNFDCITSLAVELVGGGNPPCPSPQCLFIVSPSLAPNHRLRPQEYRKLAKWMTLDD